MRIAVERFGSERQGDSMFEGYDERCFERVRGAFRIPPMFLGRAQDYNFATAYTAYIVAEAQVFQPERTEFDEIINVKIMREIAPEYWFHSLPLSVKDIQTQLAALKLVTEFVDKEGVVGTVNELASLDLVYKEPPPEVVPGPDPRLAAISAANGSGRAKEPKAASDNVVLNDGILQELADDWSEYWSGTRSFEDHSVKVMKDLIDTLSPSIRKLFNGYIALRMLPEHRHDPNGSTELLALAGDCLSKH